MKTMGKALAGLTTAKKPLVRRLKRDKAGEGPARVVESPAGFVLRSGQGCIGSGQGCIIRMILVLNNIWYYSILLHIILFDIIQYYLILFDII
jgi:hypothetical protein